MDFAKAFIKVNHTLLIHKLNQYDSRGEISRWISDFLNNGRQAAVVSGARSVFVSVQSGVPQGGIRLGPCLFLIYINDLPDTLTAQTRLFADDSRIQSGDLPRWPDPTTTRPQPACWVGEMMRYGLPPRECTSLPLQETPGTPVRTTWTETVSTAKCLGVTISRDMNWSKHINNVCTKANKTLAFLKRNLKICSRKIKEMAYKSCVRPALEYACTVWDPYTQQYIDRIQAIQRRAGVSSCNDIEDLKWTFLQGRRKTARLAMLYRIHNNIIATDGIKNKLQPPPPHPTHINDKDTTSSSRSNTAEPSTSSTHSCQEPSETGMTCPRKSLRPRPRPSTHYVSNPKYLVIFFIYFFRTADPL